MRISGTQLKNPAFALMAEAFGGFGVNAKADVDVPAAVDAALAAIRERGTFALIHLVADQRSKAY
ncbi:thiamine pyrophosphate-dependent acetolactate synthase large subunit-like protein [Arthrobacter sp. 1088]|nr:thiamine pyrophosphate-dependent acetolactate synthase large subunit-like protein [Arthrobacter sp. 1088]